MKTVGVRFAWLLFLVVCWTSSAQGMARPPAAGGGWDGDTYVHASGGWALRVQYLHKGTRSEGQDGVLLRDGQAVEPASPGEELDTPLGRLRHYGSERRNLWDVTGWNFADKAQVKPSQSLPASPPVTRAAPDDVSVAVTNGLDAAIELGVGQKLRAVMIGPAGTGFAWAHAGAPDAAILRDDGATVTAEAELPGGPTTRVWTYTALAAGQTVVVWHFARAWETDTPPAMKAQVRVTVHD